MSSEPQYKSRTAIILIILLLRSVSLGIRALALPLYFVSIGRSASEWGLGSAVYAFAMMLAEPSWGGIVDRRGPAVPLLAGALGMAALVPLLALSRSLWPLLIIQLARGAMEVAGGPAGRQALAHSLGPGRKAVGIGLFQACISAGNALGPLLGGFLVQRSGYGAAFVACGATALLAAAITLSNRARLRITRDSEPAASPRALEEEGEPARGWLTTFAALATVGASLFAGVAVGRAFIPLLGNSVLGLPPEQLAAMLSITGLLGGPLTVALGRLSDLWGRRPLIVGGLAAIGSGLLGCALARGFWSLAACNLLLSAGMAAAVPAAVALVTDITPFARQGRMIGLYGSSEDLGYMIGPLLCGLVWDAWGPRPALVISSLAVAAGIGAALAVHERPRTRAAA